MSICNAYIKIGDETIGLCCLPIFSINHNQIVIGSNNTFDISNILQALKKQHITVSIKTSVELKNLTNINKIQNWLVFENVLPIILATCQKD
jgi:hypothetical protein